MSRRCAGDLASSPAGARRALLGWFRRHQRDLPWRRTRDLYRIWVSEIMLQQTRVETVVPYYERFVAALPDVAALAAARLDRVLELWAGLGYYRRARNLHAAAQRVVLEHGGNLPASAMEWERLPGVGRYTAAAIASIALKEPVAALDGNIKRVLARLFALAAPIDHPATIGDLWLKAQQLLDRRAPGDFNQALMELGATVCTPREPDCAACPLRPHCTAFASGRQRELPVRTARRAPQHVTAVALAILRNGAVLLVRRPARGLLAGLWCLPQFEVNARPPARAEMQRSLRARLGGGLRLTAWRRLGCVEHAFTHRRWTLHVYACEAAGAVRAKKAETRWQPLARLSRGIVARLDARALELLARHSAAPASPPARARR